MIFSFQLLSFFFKIEKQKFIFGGRRNPEIKEK